MTPRDLLLVFCEWCELDRPRGISKGKAVDIFLTTLPAPGEPPAAPPKEAEWARGTVERFKGTPSALGEFWAVLPIIMAGSSVGGHLVCKHGHAAFVVDADRRTVLPLRQLGISHYDEADTGSVARADGEASGLPEWGRWEVSELDRRACPCLHTTPCHPDCACVKPYSSRPCRRCCSYGSPDQRMAMAKYLALKLEVADKALAWWRDHQSPTEWQLLQSALRDLDAAMKEGE